RVAQMSAEWESGAINAQRSAFHYHLNSTAAVAQITLLNNGWSADIEHLDVNGTAGPWPQTRAQLHFQRARDAFDLGASADFLRLADVAPWLDLLAMIQPRLAELSEAGGDVEALQVRWHHEETKEDRYSIGANLKDLRLAAGPRSVGFANLTG